MKPKHPMTCEEIAQELGVTAKAVERTLDRALAKLRKNPEELRKLQDLIDERNRVMDLEKNISNLRGQ